MSAAAVSGAARYRRDSDTSEGKASLEVDELRLATVGDPGGEGHPVVEHREPDPAAHAVVPGVAGLALEPDAADVVEALQAPGAGQDDRNVRDAQADVRVEGGGC